MFFQQPATRCSRTCGGRCRHGSPTTEVIVGPNTTRIGAILPRSHYLTPILFLPPRVPRHAAPPYRLTIPSNRPLECRCLSKCLVTVARRSPATIRPHLLIRRAPYLLTTINRSVTMVPSYTAMKVLALFFWPFPRRPTTLFLLLPANSMLGKAL